MRNVKLAWLILTFVTLAIHGQTLVPNGGVSGGGGSSTPGGSTLQLQYNNAGSFGGMAGTSWDDSLRKLILADSAADAMVVMSADPAGDDSFFHVLFAVNLDGVAPAAASGGTKGGSIYFLSSPGGINTNAMVGTGGRGGVLFFTSGNGATAQATDENTGGAGGALQIVTGSGAQAIGGTTLSEGGSGGDATFYTGNGGGAAGTGGDNYGGQGGNFSILLGSGGDADFGTTNEGGPAGQAVFGLQTGGVGSTANGADGTYSVVDATSGILFKTNYSGLSEMHAFQSIGTTFGISGCSADTAVGGAAAGSFVSRTTGACDVVITLGFTATNGWVCTPQNITTANLMRQTATSTTSCTVSGTTVTGDTITFLAVAY